MSRVESTFTVTSFDPTDWAPPRQVGIAFGEAAMGKTFSGDIVGDSVTRFLGGLTDDQTTGGYVALEWFEGSIAGRSGSCLITHSQLLVEGAVAVMSVHVIPASGTGELDGLIAAGGIAIDADGTHRLWLDLQ